MAVAYYGVCIPDKQNWVETPEGYVIFRNAVIGRTGFQRYKGCELDKDELMEQGVRFNDDDDIQLYRSPDEVFSPATIASFECKSITDGHPSELLSIENVRDHELGQVTNVHQGREPLDSGDYPLLADLVVKSKMLLDKIKSGLRELSCGYNYHVLKDGDLIKQVDIIGNHVAIVENARAGREAVIVDSSPETLITKFEGYVMSWLDRVLNSDSEAKITAWAKDAKPEQIAKVITQLGTELDARPGPDVVTRVKVATPTVEEKERQRWHEALDKALDGESSDADVTQLRKTLAGKDEEEEKEKKKGEDEKADDKEPKEGEDEEEEESEGSDESSLVIEPEDRPEKLGPGTDSATLRTAREEGARAVLKQLKPLIAKSGNKKLIAAYDAAARAVTGKSKVGTPGGYGVFAEASNRRGKDAQDSIEGSNTNKREMEAITGYEKLYAERFNVTKRG